MDVVNTYPDDCEEKNIDISDFITKINTIKRKHSVFLQESDMKICSLPDEKFFIMLKTSSNKNSKCALVIINKDTNNTQYLEVNRVKEIFKRNKSRRESALKKDLLKNYKKMYLPGESRVIFN